MLILAETISGRTPSHGLRLGDGNALRHWDSRINWSCQSTVATARIVPQKLGLLVRPKCDEWKNPPYG